MYISDGPIATHGPRAPNTMVVEVEPADWEDVPGDSELCSAVIEAAHG